MYEAEVILKCILECIKLIYFAAPEKEPQDNVKDYKSIGNVLRRYVTPDNINNVKPNGPYAKSAIKLGLNNTKNERLNLYVTWRENRGNVKVSDTVFTVVNNENFKKNSVLRKRRNLNNPEQIADAMEKKSDMEKSEMSPIGISSSTVFTPTAECNSDRKKSKTTAISTTSHKVSTRGSIRKQTKVKNQEKIQHTNASNSKTINKKKVYCICNSTKYNWKNKGAMIQCCQCSVWYHYNCLSLQKLPHHDKDSFLFECGLEHCPSNIFLHKPKIGKTIDSKVIEAAEKENELSKDVFLSKLCLTRVCNSTETKTDSDTYQNSTLSTQSELTFKSDILQDRTFKRDKKPSNRLSLKRKTGHSDVKETLENLDKESTKTDLTDSELKIPSDITCSSSESTLPSKKVKQNDIIDSKIKIHSSSPLNFDSSESNVNTVLSSDDLTSNTLKNYSDVFQPELIHNAPDNTQNHFDSKDNKMKAEKEQSTVSTKVHITAKENKKPGLDCFKSDQDLRVNEMENSSHIAGTEGIDEHLGKISDTTLNAESGSNNADKKLNISSTSMQTNSSVIKEIAGDFEMHLKGTRLNEQHRNTCLDFKNIFIESTQLVD